MDRSSSMARGKRVRDPISDEGHPSRKRPALESIVIEALRVKNLKELSSYLDPILRPIVREELEHVMAKIVTAILTAGRSPSNTIERPDERHLILQFCSELILPKYTGGKVEGVSNEPVSVCLIDANTGQVVTTGPESSMKLDVVVLDGDFNKENWTSDEFDRHIKKARDGKKPLLTGAVQVTLQNGQGKLEELRITDNSSWLPSKKFRIGLKVASGCCEGIPICEAISAAFPVKEQRGERNEKHYPPKLGDEVYRLEKIHRDGKYHKSLNQNMIYTVEQFLQRAVRDPMMLKEVLGGMSDNVRDKVIQHAKTCILSGKRYVYHPVDAKNATVIFNEIHELTALIFDGKYHSASSLCNDQKDVVDTLVKQAYGNWNSVTECNENSLSGFMQNMNSGASTSRAVVALGPHERSNSFNLQFEQCPLLYISAQNPYMDSVAALSPSHRSGIGGNNLTQSHINLKAPMQIDPPPFNLPIHFPPTAYDSRTENIQPHFPAVRTVDFPSQEEETCMGDQEMPEKENMQEQHEYPLHFLNQDEEDHCLEWMFLTDIGNNISQPSPSPCFNFDHNRTYSRSGKAIIGWLKLKVALKWNIYIRKKAAQRRAQLVELDGSQMIYHSDASSSSSSSKM